MKPNVQGGGNRHETEEGRKAGPNNTRKPKEAPGQTDREKNGRYTEYESTALNSQSIIFADSLFSAFRLSNQSFSAPAVNFESILPVCIRIYICL